MGQYITHNKRINKDTTGIYTDFCKMTDHKIKVTLRKIRCRYKNLKDSCMFDMCISCS